MCYIVLEAVAYVLKAIKVVLCALEVEKDVRHMLEGAARALCVGGWGLRTVCWGCWRACAVGLTACWRP